MTQRLVPFTLALVLATGCVAYEVRRPSTYVPPPEPSYAPQAYPPQAVPVAPVPPPLEVWYYGQHWIPEEVGGGWCYLEGPHWHDYYPDRIDWYQVDRGYYVYQGPFEFTFYAGHPLPGGGWCFISGPHVHGYYAPSGPDFAWRRGQGWVYVGPYRHDRPPPRTYWPEPPRARPAPRPPPDVRPAPAPARPPPAPRPYDPRDPRRDERSAPAPAPLPGREPPAPQPAPYPGTRPAPAPEPVPGPPANPDQPFPVGRDRPGRPDGPGHSGDAPGHGNVPPGQVGTPPGQQPQPAPVPRPQPPPWAGRRGNDCVEVENGEARPPPVERAPQPGKPPPAGVTPPIRNPDAPRGGPAEGDRGNRAAPAPAPTRPPREEKKDEKKKKDDEDKEQRDARGRIRGVLGR